MPRIRYIRSLDELDGIERDWRNLEDASGGSSFFQSWVWNRAWCDHFINSCKNVQLDVRVIEDEGGNPLAILPFYKTALAGPLLNLIQFIGHRMTFHNDILFRETENPELIKTITNVLLNSFNCRTIFHLRHLAEESPFTKELIRRGVAETQCTRLKVKAKSMVNKQSLRFGRSSRRRYNKLHREFGTEFLVKSGDDFMEAFENLVDLHQRRFASKKSSTRFSGRNLIFRRNVMEKLKGDGIFEIVQFRVGEKIIASILMLIDRGNYFFIQSGFDPEFSCYSPMRILLRETMRRGIEDLGCKNFDLGPGYEQYKFDLKPTIGKNYFCCIGGPGPYAKFMAALYRVAFKYSLPDPPGASVKKNNR